MRGDWSSERVAFRAEIEDFGGFYERTYQGAFRTALGILRDAGLAADVTQQAYVDAFENRHSFRGDAPGDAWLHRIVVNAALGAVRRRRPVVVREIFPQDSAVPDPAAGATERLELLVALGTLTPRHRAAIVLRYYHDYDYTTIAAILGTTSTNVGSLLSRALDQLRSAVEPSAAGRGALGVER
jgi:RNA polymerase sigma-70 factor (ECF subfamily)